MVCNGGTAGTTTTTSSTGTFTVTATSGSAPCVIRITGGNIVGGGSLVSVVLTLGQVRANVNQLTHALAAQLAGGDPSTLFTTPSGLSRITSTNYATAKAAIITNVIAIVGGAVGISTAFDFDTQSYTADNTLFDRLLDLVSFSISGTTGTIIYKPTGGTLLAVNLTTLVVVTTSTLTAAQVAATLPDLAGLLAFEDTLRTSLFASGATVFTAVTVAQAAFANVISSSSALLGSASASLFTLNSNGTFQVKSAYAAFASRVSTAPTFNSIIGSLSGTLGLYSVNLNFATDSAGTSPTSIGAGVDRVDSTNAASAWRLNRITSP